ncbi:hypothetical protein OROMI_029546 [Orobanche minor]
MSVSLRINIALYAFLTAVLFANAIPLMRESTGEIRQLKNLRNLTMAER